MGNQLVKQLLSLITPLRLQNMFFNEMNKKILDKEKFKNLSYAQEGEDLILCRYLDEKSDGFYVDIGAYHPKRFSNTYLFYLRGWTGINIDARPGFKDLFLKERPNDINIECGVSEMENEMTYYMFEEPALNTFSKMEADLKSRVNNFNIIDKQIVQTKPLKIIFDKYLPKGQMIDFITIDVEGLDLQVVLSNDWAKYRSKFILIEDLKRSDIAELIETSQLYKKLTDLDYVLIAKTFNTLFFKDNLRS
ncbi:Methyltransferase FkbM domain-containing protein [Nonlabens sp. Hel1_33_55]|uniref:FkbM family methyltransferase n=1 Tax=Nonlabens sp. Hel1_33_55 TaxID=1336802 RepID=UPI000875DFE8|nr:FkbM family methyltransferase [Nonlabens sp. Hel1_33_55]SCX92116.1 Methyltransferase FkbM domain-containing protein [Nonlabens sp. Hel1_33_55]